MVTEIHKLEAAARIAMGNFEGNGSTTAKARSRFPHLAYALLALAVVIGLAVTLL
jgi:hypothetical protein